MHINTDIYADRPDIESIITDLAALKEKVESIVDTSPIDETVSLLYEIIEGEGDTDELS